MRGVVALCCVLGSVLLNTVHPLLVPFLGLSGGPFLYGLAWKLGFVLGLTALTLLLYRRRAFDRRLWLAWLVMARDPRFAAMTLSHLDIIFLMVAAAFIPVAVGVVVVQLSAISFIWTMWFTHRLFPVYRAPGLGVLFLSLAAIPGVGMAVYSEHGSFGAVLGWGTAFGVGVCLVAAAVGGLNALSISLGREVRSAFGDEYPLLLVVLVGTVVNLVFLIPVLLGVGVVLEGSVPVGTWLLVFAVAFVILPVSGFLWRLGNLLTVDLSVNVVVNLFPVLSLTWLALAGYTAVSEPVFLFSGAAVVVAVNVVLFFRDRLGRWCLARLRPVSSAFPRLR